MTTTLHPLAQDYLARLEGAAGSLPPPDRAELLAEIRSHLEAGLAGTATEAGVRTLLDELGSPEAIVAAARADDLAPDVHQATGWGPPTAGPEPTAGPAPASGWGALEIAAVLLLTVGAVLIPLVGPLVGLVLVLLSTRWTAREKVVAAVLSLLPALVLALGFGLVVVSAPTSVEQTPVPSPAVSVERAP